MFANSRLNFYYDVTEPSFVFAATFPDEITMGVKCVVAVTTPFPFPCSTEVKFGRSHFHIKGERLKFAIKGVNLSAAFKVSQ